VRGLFGISVGGLLLCIYLQEKSSVWFSLISTSRLEWKWNDGWILPT